MRTNIDIDDDLLRSAMKAGDYSTKKETVEAGLRLLARQAAYREVLKWRGQLQWEGDASVDWGQANRADERDVAPTHTVQEPKASDGAATQTAPSKTKGTQKGQRRVGR